MKNRKLVMRATEFDANKYKADGSYLSEKYDGFRALWLPWSRGLNWRMFPWANTLRDDHDYISTGLWTRRGKPIMAPAFFLDQLPSNMPLDGELHMGRGVFEKVASVVRKLDPIDTEWMEVRYSVFDIPSYSEFFRTGTIREGGKAGDPAYEVEMRLQMFNQFVSMDDPYFNPRRFSQVYLQLQRMEWAPQIDFVLQTRLPITRKAAEDMVSDKLAEMVEAGGEGLMLRQPHSIWEPYDSADLAKVKKLRDSEAQVIGYTEGKGRLTGMVGAFRVIWWNGKKDVEFDLSGFTDVQRTQEFLPIGTRVTFKYGDITKDGLPKFGRFWRKHEA